MAPGETPPPPPEPAAPPGGPIPPPSPPRSAPHRNDVFKGIALTFLLHIGALMVAGLLAAIPGINGVGGYVGIAVLAGLGLVQWLYLIPVIRWARRRGWHDLERGLWIGGALTFLLSVACWGVPFLMSRFAG